MDVVTLGESMALFTPITQGNMRYASMFSLKIAGAESNVAIGLARLGHQCGWMSRLGKDEFGKKILNFIRGEGVDVSCVSFDSSAPTGLYFKEIVSDKEINIQYYRKDSAASRMKPSDLNEAYIAQAKYLHLTGITPALSEGCKETVYAAIEMAKKNGVTVIFDPNMRRRLWSEKEAKEVLLDIISNVDIVLPGQDEAMVLFGEYEPEDMAQQFLDHGVGSVVLKLGAEGAYYKTNKESGFVKAFPVERVVDPVGAGDGFAAGFISGLLDGLTFVEAVKRACAVGAMVTQINGDIEGLPEREKLERFISGSYQKDVNR